MLNVARPIFQNLLHLKARQLLPKADTIVLMSDGKSFKSRDAIGVFGLQLFHGAGEGEGSVWKPSQGAASGQNTTSASDAGKQDRQRPS